VGWEGQGHDMSLEGVEVEAEAGHSLDAGRVDGDKDAGVAVEADRGSLQYQSPDDRSRLVVAEPGIGTGRTAGRKGRCNPWIGWDRQEERRGRR
jgi:hypothetical protein